MQKDILHIRAKNDRTFYENRMISKHELEKRVQPYLKEYGISFTSFLTENTIRNISGRKTKRRIEKLQTIAIIAFMIFGLYIVGDDDMEAERYEILAYNNY